MNLQTVKKNAPIIMAVVIIMAVLFGGNAWMNHRIDVTTGRAAVAEQALKEQRTVNAELQKEFDQKSAAYQKDKADLDAKNDALTKSMTQRDAAAKQQQAVVANESTADLAADLSKQTDAKPGQVVATTTGAQVDTDVLRTVVSQLGTLHVKEADIFDLQTINSNLAKEVLDSTGAIQACTTQVSGLKQEISKQETACKAEVSLVKAKARKSKRNWFIIGYIAGFLTRTAVTHGL